MKVTSLAGIIYDCETVVDNNNVFENVSENIWKRHIF